MVILYTSSNHHGPFMFTKKTYIIGCLVYSDNYSMMVMNMIIPSIPHSHPFKRRDFFSPKLDILNVVPKKDRRGFEMPGQLVKGQHAPAGLQHHRRTRALSWSGWLMKIMLAMEIVKGNA